MLRFLCLHCDARFSLEAEQPLRCPACLRTQGLQPLSVTTSALQPGLPMLRRRRWAISSALVLLVVAAGGVWGWGRWQRFAAQPPLRPLPGRELAHYLGQAGKYPWNALLQPSAALRSEAARLGLTKRPGKAAMLIVVEELRRRRKSGQWQPTSSEQPPPHDALAAAQVWRAMQRGKASLTSLEVASLAVALLRAADQPAMLAQVFSWPGEGRPADPIGHLGYFAVAMLQEKGQHPIADGWGEHAVKLADEQTRLLTDVQAAAAALSQTALAQLGRDESTAAYANSRLALELDAQSAWVRGAHALLLARSGGVEAAARELEAAAQLHAGPAQMLNMSQVFLAMRDLSNAERSLARALENQPRYWQAHMQAAQIHLAAARPMQARQAIETALGLAPAARRAELRALTDTMLQAGAAAAVAASPPALPDPAALQLRDPSAGLQLEPSTP